MVQPPRGADWKKVSVGVDLSGAETYLATYVSLPDAERLVEAHWDAICAEGGALFLRHLPAVLGESVGYSSAGFPAYRPTPQPTEIWFIPAISFTDLWTFASRRGFVTPVLPPQIVQECSAFLCDLAKREPISLWWIAEDAVGFRHLTDGRKFAFADMRRASELNLAVLGRPQDASHNVRNLARSFVKAGFFYLGV